MIVILIKIYTSFLLIKVNCAALNNRKLYT